MNLFLFQNPTMRHYSRKLAFVCGLLCVFAAIHAVTPDLRAQGRERAQAVLSQPAMEAMIKINEAITAGNFSEATRVASEMLSKATPGSYDEALLNLASAQLRFQMDDLEGAIPFMERALALPQFLDSDKIAQYTLSLAHLYYTTENREKSLEVLADFQKDGGRMTTQMLSFYVILLVDVGRKEEALKPVEQLLRSKIDPDVDAYKLAATVYQELGNYEAAAACLERMIELKPDEEQFWQGLLFAYSQNGNSLAMLNTIERAQERGLLLEERWHTSLAQLYYQLERYETTAKLLADGIKSDNIENSRANWELMAFAWQLAGYPEKQLNTLIQASKEGEWPEIDAQIASIYWNAQDIPNTIKWIDSAFSKGTPPRPGDLLIVKASAAITNDDFDTAEEAINQAEKYPEVSERVEQIRRFVLSPEARAAAEEAAAEAERNRANSR